MTNHNPERSTAPRQVPGDQPGDYGVPADRFGAAADAGNTEDIETLVEPLDDDDDVHERLRAISLVNTEQPDILRHAPEQAPEQASDADR